MISTPYSPPTPPGTQNASPPRFMSPLHPPTSFEATESKLLSFEVLTHPLSLILCLSCAGNLVALSSQVQWHVTFRRQKFTALSILQFPPFLLLLRWSLSLRVKTDTNISLRD